jgi:hypothetical protein
LKKPRNKFDEYMDQASMAERYAAANAAAFESRSLMFLLRAFGMAQVARTLRDACERRTGQPDLRYADFGESFPSFPVLIKAQQFRGLHADPRCLLPSLFKAYQDTPFFVAYDEWYETIAQFAEETGRAVGLVFTRKGIKNGLIIHNHGGAFIDRCRGLVLVYQSGKKKTQHIFLQPFQAFVEAAYARGHGWRPDL